MPTIARRYTNHQDQLPLTFIATVQIEHGGCELCARKIPQRRRLCLPCAEAVKRTWDAMLRAAREREEQRQRVLARSGTA